MQRSWGTSASKDTKAHACNCIGCCPKCGQCRTAPWHGTTCSDIEALNEAKRTIIANALEADDGL